MVLRKGKHNKVSMLPTTVIEAQALASLMKNYKKCHQVAFGPMVNAKIGVVAVIVSVGEDATEIILDAKTKLAEMDKVVNVSDK